ncbi:hypothetical protein F4810DRAFT_655344 [Camillea tinctor]|nr:hypothetical protein F4810DRAFT_655344 [Camillea tinctor]
MQSKEDVEITNIAVYSRNIDFMLPFAEARMKPALAYLDGLTGSKSFPPTTAPVIFIQECTPSDFTTIAATPWVKERLSLADLDPTNWATTHYGTTMLIDSHLPITAAFRVHYSKTPMDRDALFVDVSLGSQVSHILWFPYFQDITSSRATHIYRLSKIRWSKEFQDTLTIFQSVHMVSSW